MKEIKSKIEIKFQSTWKHNKKVHFSNNMAMIRIQNDNSR